MTMGKDPKRGFPRFCPRTASANADNRPPTQKCVSTYRILVIFLDGTKMLRDHFFKQKVAEKPEVSEGFRSVVGTDDWQTMKETAAE